MENICKPSVEKWQAANISCKLGGKLSLLLTGGLELFGLQLGQKNAKAVICCQKISPLAIYFFFAFKANARRPVTPKALYESRSTKPFSSVADFEWRQGIVPQRRCCNFMQ